MTNYMEGKLSKDNKSAALDLNMRAVSTHTPFSQDAWTDSMCHCSRKMDCARVHIELVM